MINKVEEAETQTDDDNPEGETQTEDKDAEECGEIILNFSVLMHSKIKSKASNINNDLRRGEKTNSSEWFI